MRRFDVATVPLAVVTTLDYPGPRQNETGPAARRARAPQNNRVGALAKCHARTADHRLPLKWMRPDRLRACCAFRTWCFHFFPNRSPSIISSTESSHKSGKSLCTRGCSSTVDRAPLASRYRIASEKTAVEERVPTCVAMNSRLAARYTALNRRLESALADRSKVVICDSKLPLHFDQPIKCFVRHGAAQTSVRSHICRDLADYVRFVYFDSVLDVPIDARQSEV